MGPVMNNQVKNKWRWGVPFWNLEVEKFYISNGRQVRNGYTMDAEHVHKHYEMVFNFSRIQIRHTAAGNSYTSQTPCVLFRAPYVLHSINTDQTYSRTVIGFDPCLLREYDQILDLGRLGRVRECMIPCTESKMEQLDLIITRMYRLWWKERAEKPWVGLLTELLFEVNQMLPADFSAETKRQAYIHALLQYVVENPGEDLTTETLAKKFFVGRTKLTQDCITLLGMPPHEYVKAVRITHAKRLLVQGVSIDAIANYCGFSQESSFIYMFRRETGMTPGEYRKRNVETLF